MAPEASELPGEELQWTSVALRDVFDRGMRLEASCFGIEAKHARDVLARCRWPMSMIAGGEDGRCVAYRPPLYKRIWAAKGYGVPYYLPSQVTDIKPEPERELSTHSRVDIDLNRAKPGEILLTCSGTIGDCAYVSATLSGLLFSQNIIHLAARSNTEMGFVYAYLRTPIAQALLRSNEYGAVISHIDPQHLEGVPIPIPPPVLRLRIHQLVVRSYELRDESNSFLQQASRLLAGALSMPPLSELRQDWLSEDEGRSFSAKLSGLQGRFDASYHLPIIQTILEQLRNSAREVTTLADSRISKAIVLPGRFARVYVQEGQGVPFFGGKQLLELDPSHKKYLSLLRHKKRIREQLTLEENMVLITCSGTIGRVVMVPEHWVGWTANQHIMRIVPASKGIAGYLAVFLASEAGRQLIRRFTYGSVVDELHDRDVANVAVPLLKDEKVQKKINALALKANQWRTEAYRAEQEAIRIMNDEVIHATAQRVAPEVGTGAAH